VILPAIKLTSIPNIDIYKDKLPNNERPDITIICEKLDTILIILIIDISYCDDGNILTLHEQQWDDIAKNKDLWNHKGVRIRKKHEQTSRLQRSDPRRILAEALTYCPPARYYHRYNSLQKHLQDLHPKYTVSICPIIAGVTGTAVFKPIQTITTL
jgi:hypothetical protein